MAGRSYGSKHEGLRMSSPPARTCDAPSPKRRLLPPADQPLLFARPASVHFGGFALGQRYEQRVVVVNNSAKPVRLRFVLPAKGFARAAFAGERRPFVPAGLSEELVVTFTPTAFQYHYDCIQVRAEEVAYASNTDTALLGSCVVPIHAYPVLNDVRFPSRVDFGAVARGGVGRRHFELTCSVPIEFEYELELAKAHPSFTVFPLKGVIPANGSARIEVEFRPLVFATASAEVVLHVSQFGFSPATCALVGSSSPSDTQKADAVPADDAKAGEPPTRPASVRAKTPPSEPRSGASPTKSSRPESKPRRPHAGGRSASAAADADGDSSALAMNKVGGLEIPADLSTMTSVNFVLTQQPGKLKPKDLKKAVKASRDLRKRQKDEQAKLSAGGDADDPSIAAPATSQHQGLALTFQVLVREEENFLKREAASRQIKEMFFAQELSDMEHAERELEFQSHKTHVGEELLTPPQRELLEHMRALNLLALERQQREKQRSRFATEAFGSQSQPTPETPDPPRGALPAHFVSAYTPDFKAYKNDLWARRKRVVQSFVRAVSTCVVRARAQRRLGKIRRWLGSSRTRAQVRERVALDWRRHGAGKAGDSGPSEASRASPTVREPQRLVFESFPLVEEKTHTRRAFVAQPADWELKADAFAFLPLRERDEALLSGHEPLELPPLPTYVPLENGRELRVGAADECGGPLSVSEEQAPADSKAAVVPQQVTRTASLLQQVSPDAFVRPSASVRPLVRLQSPRETDPSFVLRPQRVFRTPPTHFGAVQEQSVGMRSLVALRDAALALPSVYMPATERPRAQPLLLPVAATVATDAEDPELFRDVWFVSQRPSSGIPPLAASSDEVPCLSDSESDGDDDDDERKRRPRPTWRDAELLFEGDAGDRATTQRQGAEEGELLGRANGVCGFERYRRLIRLERAYNEQRESLLHLLPNRLRAATRGLEHPDFALVVEGHGPERPLHQPQR